MQRQHSISPISQIAFAACLVSIVKIENASFSHGEQDQALKRASWHLDLSDGLEEAVQICKQVTEVARASGFEEHFAQGTQQARAED